MHEPGTASATARDAAAAAGDPTAILALQRAAFRDDPDPSVSARRAALARLRGAVVRRRGALEAAMDADFGGRSGTESATVDLLPTVLALRHAERRVGAWMRSRRCWPHPLTWPAGARVVYQPLGVVGIMSPWNYPVLLALGPLVGALAAGNRAMLKLSEFTPATNAVLRELINEAFAPDAVAVIEGGADVSRAFAQLPFDHLLFTGSTAVGRRVMEAAAANLVPVTLELGGKSPVIVDASADPATTAERLVFGKLLNAGQTCIAPDYVLCTPAQREPLLAAIRAAIARLYPRLGDNPDYAAIINGAHRERLQGLLADARARGARVEAVNPAGEVLAGTGRIAPHLVTDAPESARVLDEEIFGPILPVVTVPDLDAATAWVARRPRPLALYYFGRDPARQRQLERTVHAGGLCINDTILHAAQDSLPFGGIGASGMGSYHGWYGFRTFSHEKAVFRKGRINSARLVYPPYGSWIQRLLHRVMLR